MKYDGHSELVKAAPKRLKDALELLEQPSRDKNGSDADYRHLCGAYYLAGYAVECALKVYIILLLDERNSARFAKWSDVIKHFQASSGQVNLTGAESHRLRRLCAIAELEPQIDSDQAMKENWGICSKWDYNVRYRPSFMTDRRSVTQFVDACDAAYRWVRSRLPFH